MSSLLEMSPRTAECANAQVELGPHFAFLTLEEGTRDIQRSWTVNSRHQRSLFIVRIAAIGSLTAAAAIAGCKRSEHASGDISRNWLPAKQNAYMGVPAAEVQAAIQRRLAAPAPSPVTDDQWKHVQKLYATFNQSLLWLDDKGVHQPRVSALLNALADADSDALELSAYPLTALGQALDSIDHGHPTADQLANADVMLSAAYATFGENMLTGQLQPASLGQSWHINSREEHVDSALALSLREDDLAAGLVRMRPQDPGYDSLRVEFARFRDLVSHGGWSGDSIAAGKQLHRGDHDSPARLDALRARLRSEGYAVDSTSKPGVYDASLAGAVAEFQARHAIGVDSMLGQETLDALNVPADYRLAQIASNLERYRWMPRSMGSRYIVVNVPQFHLTAYDSGQQSLEMKVIVGQEYEDKATPVFSDSMEFVVFRPYWNVTPDIAAKEIFPKAAEDPDYLSRNNMQVYDDHGRRAVRQLPGPKNSLGLVKFMFPNDYNIYLHDTPNGELFKKDVRAFSHGCIRLEKPVELAQWVLGWPADRVETAMHDGPNNHTVNLPRKIPVYIVYFTTFVRDGQLNFGNDLYDRDNQLVEQMRDVATQSPETAQALAALRHLAS
jgi:L,D-transpeptidase YcbB